MEARGGRRAGRAFNAEEDAFWSLSEKTTVFPGCHMGVYEERIGAASNGVTNGGKAQCLKNGNANPCGADEATCRGTSATDSDLTSQKLWAGSAIGQPSWMSFHAARTGQMGLVANQLGWLRGNELVQRGADPH